jgi:hypothetical protein
VAGGGAVGLGRRIPAAAGKRCGQKPGENPAWNSARFASRRVVS